MSMISSNGSPSPGKFSSAEKRAVHNALERKRRDHIKDMFTQLKDSVPNMAGEKMSNKASRAQILKKACDYIQMMRKKNSNSAKDLEELSHQVLRTRRQIAKLESLKNTNRYVDTLPVTHTPLSATSSTFPTPTSSAPSQSLRTAATTLQDHGNFRPSPNTAGQRLPPSQELSPSHNRTAQMLQLGALSNNSAISLTAMENFHLLPPLPLIPPPGLQRFPGPESAGSTFTAVESRI
ncbi:putative Protein max [Hypsibius exemplaris]|uniref:BHLH domain-containing protein n=1 Tax=Hypsibius exemplaris TaxID=2072580 RepID=A0A9X6RL09_HYPEX|nr:putative Protein max [Hypsibius exemplaris]